MAHKSFREGRLHKGWSREGPEGNYCRKLHDLEIETFITSGQALIQNTNVGSMLAAIQHDSFHALVHPRSRIIGGLAFDQELLDKTEG